MLLCTWMVILFPRVFHKWDKYSPLSLCSSTTLLVHTPGPVVSWPNMYQLRDFTYSRPAGWIYVRANNWPSWEVLHNFPQVSCEYQVSMCSLWYCALPPSYYPTLFLGFLCQSQTKCYWEGPSWYHAWSCDRWHFVRLESVHGKNEFSLSVTEHECVAEASKIKHRKGVIAFETWMHEKKHLRELL